METVHYKLVRRVEVRGKTYAEVKLRRPLVRDLIAAERQEGKVAGDAALIAICGDIPLGDLGHFDAADFRAIVDLADAAGFFGGSATFEGSSLPSTPEPAGDSPTS